MAAGETEEEASLGGAEAGPALPRWSSTLANRASRLPTYSSLQSRPVSQYRRPEFWHLQLRYSIDLWTVVRWYRVGLLTRNTGRSTIATRVGSITPNLGGNLSRQQPNRD